MVGLHRSNVCTQGFLHLTLLSLPFPRQRNSCCLSLSQSSWFNFSGCTLHCATENAERALHAPSIVLAEENFLRREQNISNSTFCHFAGVRSGLPSLFCALAGLHLTTALTKTVGQDKQRQLDCVGTPTDKLCVFQKQENTPHCCYIPWKPQPYCKRVKAMRNHSDCSRNL